MAENGGVPIFGGGAGCPSNTMLPWLRSTSLVSGILIHPAVYPQQTWAKNWGGEGCAPFGVRAGSPSNTMWHGLRPTHAKLHLDPSNRLATVHQRHRQDRERSDSIGRTVLETVARKLLSPLSYLRLKCTKFDFGSQTPLEELTGVYF